MFVSETVELYKKINSHITNWTLHLFIACVETKTSKQP